MEYKLEPTFGEPIILILLLIVPLTMILYWWYGKIKKKSAVKFSSIALKSRVKMN